MPDETEGGRAAGENFYAGTAGDVPSNYDRLLGPVFFVDFAADLARRAAATAPLRVLEVAAGTGILSRSLRDLLPTEAQLVVTDLNPAMLELARGKFAVAERVAFEPADALALPFPDRSFDAVVCQFGAMFFPNREQAFREAHRVLGGGGRYLFSVWDSLRRNPIGQLTAEIAARFSPADPPRFFEAPFSCHRIDPLREELDAAGFADHGICVVAIEKTIADVASYARGAVYGSPLLNELQARGIDPERVVDALAQAIPREFGNAPTRTPLRAIVFDARRP